MIRENPGGIEEAIQRLQQLQEERQQAQIRVTLETQRAYLEQDPNAPVLGNPDGDITLVEFFDYNCPYCKRAKPIVQALLESDPNVRLVYREWPVLIAAMSTGSFCRREGK
ncbi:DsbA family protein [Roseibium sp.]|uniref:DsbA family protein n=1 Tax=Roseibium sp. TaxID=1936156 RepID=UPI003A9800A5